MTKTLCTLFIALLAFAANSAFAQKTERWSDSTKSKKKLPAEATEYSFSDTLPNGRIVFVKKIVDSIYKRVYNIKSDIKPYRITVQRDLHQTPINEHKSKNPISENRSAIDIYRLNTLLKSLIRLGQNETAHFTFKIDKNGKINEYRLTLEKESYKLNSTIDFAKIIDSIDAAKIFPTWRTMFPKDTIEYGWRINTSINNRAGKSQKNESSIIVNKREVRCSWREDESGLIGSYRLKVLCKPKAKPIKRKMSNISKDAVLSQHIDREKVADIVRSCISFGPNRTRQSMTITVYPSGKIHSYSMQLDSVSYHKNTPKDYARVIRQLNRAKLFPAWRDAYPYDSVEHGYNYYVNIDHKTN